MDYRRPRKRLDAGAAQGGADWKPLRALPDFSWLLEGASTPPLIPHLTDQSIVPTLSKNDGFAVTVLMLGIVSLTFGLCCCYGLPFKLLGIGFSLVGLAQIKKEPDAYSGQGLAIAGLICSIVSLTLATVLVTIGIAVNGHQILNELKKL